MLYTNLPSSTFILVNCLYYQPFTDYLINLLNITMNKKFILFVICLVGLFAFQSKVIMPVIYDIAASDFFLEDSGDEKNRMSTSNLLTNSAFDQCNKYIENKLSPDNSITFPDQPLNAFSLGNFQYIINADIEILPPQEAPFSRRYVCRIKFLQEDDNTATSNSENWSVDGLSGLDDI